MKKATLFLALCISSFVMAQYEITIEASILDLKTSQPIPYVNIGFLSKSIGTVSDESGKFQLVYDEALVGETEILQISSLGYETLSVPVKQLERLLINTNKILLKPKIEALSEVFLSNEKREERLLGTSNQNPHILGYWKDRKALGGEIATKIEIKNKNTKLKELRFYVNDNQSDSLKIRVNIYDYKRRYPREKILKRNLFYTVKVKSGEVSIDLEPYNITVDKDFVVSIELIEVYGSLIEFALSGDYFSGPSYTRYVSQDKWERQVQLGMNFSVLTSVPNDKDDDEFLKRPIPKKITLYWDASFFRDTKHVDNELNLLKSYLKQLKNVNVEVVTFNHNIVSKKVFNVTKSTLNDLMSFLKQTQYKGHVNFDLILKNNTFNPDAILLFTDGKSLFSRLEPEVNVPVFAISSSSQANHNALQKTTYYGDGHYINLQQTTQEEGLEFLTFEIPDKQDYSRKEGNTVSGTVFDINGPIHNATVRVKSTLNEVETNSEGFFKIVADNDAILEINYLGMLPKEIIADQTKTVRIAMLPEGEILDEVKLDGKGKLKEIITGYGRKNEDAIGYSIDMISSKDISPSAVFLADVIRGRFAGVRVTGFGNEARYFIRGVNSINSPAPAAFQVHGLLYTEPPFFLDVQQIESITILKSLAATNRYGALGRGGVFVIKMKYETIAEGGKPENKALIEGNDYTDKIDRFYNSVKKSATRLRLEEAKSYEDALQIYSALISERTNESILFYLDASDYFARWDNDFSVGLLENATRIAYDNVKALKTIAYKLEEKGRFVEAKLVYERIAILKPKAIQSYRDLAAIYNASGDYKASMNLYKQMLGNEIPDLNFTPIGASIINEIQHLVAHHRLDVNYKDLHPDLLSAKFNIDLRIVFEWNNPNTEFEFQFVNPNKKYFKWQHTKFDNKERLLDEIQNGYHMEQYIIDDAESGEWLVNIEALSKQDPINPTYLKYTVYKNYGLPNEEKDVKVLKLYTQNEKLTLDSFIYK